MLVVLDTGVFVSALVTPGGTASRVVVAGVAGRVEYLCPRLVAELADVVERPKIARLVPEELRRRFLADVVAVGRDVEARAPSCL